MAYERAMSLLCKRRAFDRHPYKGMPHPHTSTPLPPRIFFEDTWCRRQGYGAIYLWKARTEFCVDANRHLVIPGGSMRLAIPERGGAYTSIALMPTYSEQDVCIRRAA